MLELLFCSMLTILPDYLFRRFVQGKRFGREITLYSVWFELRWGITTCLILTIALILTVFYNHPATTNVTLFYRTIPILPQINGRVSEVLVDYSGHVEKGALIFKLDDSTQQAAVETARRKVAEVEAAMAVARADVTKAEHQLAEANSDYQTAQYELETKQGVRKLDPGALPGREIGRLETVVQGRQAAVNAATAARDSAQEKLSTQLQAEKTSAEAALDQAKVELAKTVIRAGVSGRVEQFTLRPGDVVNPLMRPAGVLIPDNAGRYLAAGFDQIEAQIMKVGMIAEVTCISKPFAVIPMVVTGVQGYIAAGQFRGGEQLLDPQQVKQPGTLIAFLDPLYQGGLDGVTPGSSCIANAYSSNHDEIVAPETGAIRRVALHAVDGLALVHALLLRIQALLLPFQTLVFGGH
jgi:multidrug resistance efflux pump